MNLPTEANLNETNSSDPEVEQLMKLPSTVTQLTSKDGVKVYLVGTAHFSHESQEDVAKVKSSSIRYVKAIPIVIKLLLFRRF